MKRGNSFNLHFRSLMDKITFKQILLLWILIVVVFGLFYFYFMRDRAMLFYIREGKSIDNLFDSIYFSFVTATTTGFGDIIPLGLFKIVAIIEVLLGFILLAVVTSKLVSIKQDVILTEIYEISYNERINKLRSSLLLSRQNLGNLINNINEGLRNEKSIIHNMDFYLVYLENIFNETSSLISKNSHGHFIKKLDSVNTEIIFNSLLQSLEKLHELIVTLDKYRIRWRFGSNINAIKKLLLLNENLFERLNNSKDLIEHSLDDLNIRKERLTRGLLALLEVK